MQAVILGVGLYPPAVKVPARVTNLLLADRGYDTNDILAYAASTGMQTVLPPKKNRKKKRGYDECLCKPRHFAENCFLVLKRWATRYAKTSNAFIAAVHIRCISIWAVIRA